MREIPPYATRPQDRLRPVRGIAFDVDGTLIDFVRFKRVASEEAARAMVDAGLDMPWREAMHRLEEAYYAHGIDGDTAFEGFLRDANGSGRADPRMLHAGIAAYLRAKQALFAPYPRTVPTLIHLLKRGYALGIITDAPRDKALQRLAATGLVHFFDAVVTADDNLAGKANGLPFQQLARKLDLPLGAMAMVGDHPERDIASAASMGMATVFAAYGAEDRPQGPREPKAGEEADVTIHRVDELVGLFPAAARHAGPAEKGAGEAAGEVPPVGQAGRP